MFYLVDEHLQVFLWLHLSVHFPDFKTEVLSGRMYYPAVPSLQMQYVKALVFLCSVRRVEYTFGNTWNKSATTEL